MGLLWCFAYRGSTVHHHRENKEVTPFIRLKTWENALEKLHSVIQRACRFRSRFSRFSEFDENDNSYCGLLDTLYYIILYNIIRCVLYFIFVPISCGSFRSINYFEGTQGCDLRASAFESKIE